MRLNNSLLSLKNRFEIDKISQNLKKYRGVIAFFIFEFISFHILVFLYIFNSLLIKYLFLLPLVPKSTLSNIQGSYSKFYIRVTNKLDTRKGETITKLDIISLAIRNMQVKRARTLVTVGGVSIGIGAIVFLVSIGYGLQDLVISRVAKLDELSQVDVIPQAGSKIKINDKVISDISQFNDVSDVYPLIAVVGRVNYQNSISDMAAYGVTTGYLEKSAIQPFIGNPFQSDDLTFDVTQIPQLDEGQVAGMQDDRSSYVYGEEIEKVVIEMAPNAWIRVRSAPSPTAPILGYTKRMEGTQTGVTIAGQVYDSGDRNGRLFSDAAGNPLGKWVKSTVYIWEETTCEDSETDCIDGIYKALRDENGYLAQQEGFFSSINLQTSEVNTYGQVLGDSITSEAIKSESFTVVESEDGWVDVLDEGAAIETNTLDTVSLSENSLRQAVVNVAMLKILNITPEDALGEKFSVSFVIPTNLLEDSSMRVESIPAEYEIVGVTPDDDAPIIYVPFIDLRSLGIQNYSQLKVVSEAQDSLEILRKQIEATGFSTSSVVDTIEQITNLFTTIRLVLGVMGMIALAVAALGMFNTLTVSLLERSREVGLMKAMGMTTTEVQELFLTESIIMGFCAGLAGLSIGWIGGKLLSLVLSIVSITKGQGLIDISSIPVTFVLIILFLSFLVGIGTGIFPAKRSTKISALDALRYE